MCAASAETLDGHEYAVRPRNRSFRVYNVGMAKTGTRSIAGMFSTYSSLHELLFPDTVRVVRDQASRESWSTSRTNSATDYRR